MERASSSATTVPAATPAAARERARPQHQPDDAPRPGAERDAHANLPAPVRNVGREHPEDSDRRQQQRHQRKPAEQRGREPIARQ